MNLGDTNRAPFQKLDGSDESLGMDFDVTNLDINLDLGQIEIAPLHQLPRQTPFKIVTLAYTSAHLLVLTIFRFSLQIQAI